MAKRVGIPPEAFALPLAVPLKDRQDNLFTVTEQSPAELAIALRKHQLDGALLSPIDYAKDYAMYRIVPGVGIASSGESQTVLLVFHESLRDITTIAVDPHFTSEIVLASIILSERYDSHPKIVPFSGTVETMMQSADCALVVGNAAFRFSDHSTKIDLVDEWSDMTELPFVHGIWVSREQDLTVREMEALKYHLPPEKLPEEEIRSFDPSYFASFQYNLNGEAVAGISEFFRMAYFHGILNDITDVKFFSESADGAAQ